MQKLLGKTTDHLQPLDVGVFASLESEFNKVKTDFYWGTLGGNLDKAALPKLLTKLWPETDPSKPSRRDIKFGMSYENITSGFRACTIFAIFARKHSLSVSLSSRHVPS
jgi:hypothetical protein